MSEQNDQPSGVRNVGTRNIGAGLTETRGDQVYNNEGGVGLVKVEIWDSDSRPHDDAFVNIVHRASDGTVGNIELNALETGDGRPDLIQRTLQVNGVTTTDFLELSASEVAKYRAALADGSFTREEASEVAATAIRGTRLDSQRSR